MSLTKGQKGRRDAEIAEAKTVTDHNRVTELLESQFVYMTIGTLLKRRELGGIVLPWWSQKSNRDKCKISDFYEYEAYVRNVVENHELTDEQLADLVADGCPNLALRHKNCGDATLRAVARVWHRWDACVSAGVDRNRAQDISNLRRALTLPQLKRMAEVGEEPPPPLRDRSRELGYYSPEETERRELVAELANL